MTLTKTKNLVLFLAVITLFTAPLRAGEFVADIKRDTEKLCAPPSRLLGSEGHEQAKALLADRITALPGVKLVRQPFPVIIPETRQATITVDNNGLFQGNHDIYPVWPDNVRLKSTPENGLSGQTIYIGKGDYKDLPAKSLRGNIAVTEMSAYEEGTWVRAFEFGAKAVLLVGSENDTDDRPFYKSIFKPRYYIPDGPLADALRRDQVGDVTIHCDAQWTTATAENLVAMVPGTDPSARPIVLAAKYDAMSVIPDLAPGADNAVDAAFLMRTLTYLSKHPPRRGVIVAFVDAFGFNLMGMRELMVMLNVTPDDATRQAYEKEINQRIEEYEQVAEQVDKLGTDPLKALPKLEDKAQYGTLQRYVKDVLSPEIIAIREQLFELRLKEAELDGEEAEAVTARKKKKLARKHELDAILSGIVARGELPENLLDECATVWRKIRERTQKQLQEIKQSIALFDTYDQLRAEVMRGLSITAPEEVPVPFVLGIDLSDAGTNVGPAYKCEVLYAPYAQEARKFTRWLTTKLKSSTNPYAQIPSARLEELGLRADGLKAIVEKFINAEAVTSPEMEQVISEAVPDISDEATNRILGAIDQKIELGRDQSDAETYDRILKIITQEMPYMEGIQVEKLVAEILNQEALSGGVAPESTTVQSRALLTGVCPSFQATGATWTTLEGVRDRLDTPQDTFERLDWERLTPQIRITALLVEMLLNDDSFVPDDQQARKGNFPDWHMPSGKAVSESVAETIARTPQPGMLVTSFNDKKGPAVVNIRGHEFITTRVDGRFRFRPKPADCWWPARNRFVKAYSLDDDGRIVRAIGTVKSMTTGNTPGRFTMSRNPPLAPVRAETFNCTEVNGPIFYDPRYQTPLNGGRVFDVGRGGPPETSFWSDTEGPMFGLLKPKTHYQVILGLGGGKNRFVLMNVPEDLNETDQSLQGALKTGFEAGKPLPALAELISAQDFYRIDEWRLQRLESAGVVVDAIRDIHSETKSWLDKADAAYEADRGDEHKRASTIALANEIRAYHAVKSQASDVTRGSIFLLLLIVPFAIAMERLLFASPEVGKQISKTILIFIVMFAILFSFHPGFQITTMPAVILIAFMILLLSIAVINMILKKFRADMEELRRGTMAEASGAQTGRRGVMMSAVWLGIANMRKRFVRTLLTGLTIVLITFSLLCFTSSSTYRKKRTSTLDNIEKVTHNGVLLQHPRNQELDPNTKDSISNMLGGNNLQVGRYWIAETTNPQWRLHVRNAETNQLAALKSGLGLDAKENEASNIDTILTNWEQFAEGNGCYVSEIVARRLGIEPGQSIMVGGQKLTLIDTFDGRSFEEKIHKLDGQSLLPLDYTVQEENLALGSQENMEEMMAEGGTAIEPDPTLVHVSADGTIILPAALAKKLEASLRSIVIKSDERDAAALAGELVSYIVYPVYYGAEDGVKAIVSTPLLPSAPRKILIPIIIAALIIFNTMLNSIAERKREIYIYSSLGLAPRHIGVLFLGEALTYGL
ncbi:MAG: FtsX-like permease family protein, partial [Lentisphaeria bacterium]